MKGCHGQRPKSKTKEDQIHARGKSTSDTRVILLNTRLFGKARPVVASVCQAGLVGQRGNLIIPLNELQRKTLTRVPTNMAVHEPCARIVSLECEHKITAGWQHSRVSARRVAQVERNR